jgi:hypothetical protein
MDKRASREDAVSRVLAHHETPIFRVDDTSRSGPMRGGAMGNESGRHFYGLGVLRPSGPDSLGTLGTSAADFEREG